LLENHQLEEYTIQWENINTTPDSLLSFVDLTAAKAKLDSLKKIQSDSIVTIEKKAGALTTPASSSKMYLLYIILFASIGLASLYFLLKKFSA
jgi:hypothetical protein